MFSPGFRSIGVARPQITAGKLGAIDVRQLESGGYRARASNRDDGGALHRLELAPPPPA